MLVEFATPRFVARAKDRRLHDGTIEAVNHIADKLYVAIKPLEGGPATVVFVGVRTVRDCQPESLYFSSLVEWTDCPPLQGYEFVNWFQPGDDWNPVRAGARLEIIARGYHVMQGWVEPGREL